MGIEQASDYTPDDDARLSAGLQQAYRHAAPTPEEELAAEDARAREQMSTPRPWSTSDDDD